VSGALVLGADYRALGIARSLGRRGIPVWAVDVDGRLAARSRYVPRTLPWRVDAPVEHVLELAARHGLQGWTLFVTSDECAALVARNRDALAAAFRLTTAGWGVVRLAYDKRETYRLAERAGVAVPATSVPGGRAALEALDVSFPAILKPALKEAENAFTAAKAWPVADRGALLARWDEAARLVAPELIMVQELVPGGGEAQLSYGALCDGGRVLAAVSARRRRQYPVDFGRSSCTVETIVDAELEAAARALLEAMRYDGVAEVEFKRDPRDGRTKVLDVNPRLWTWHTLCGRAGVDFPWLLWLRSRGEPLPEVSAQPGVRWTRLVTDVPAALAELRQGRLSVREYLRGRRGPTEPALFALDDPLPALLDLPLLARRALGGV
jgi:D-aspartate ligase